MGMPVNDTATAAMAQASGTTLGVRLLDLPTTINLARYTENMSWAYFQLTIATKTGSVKTAVVGNQVLQLSEIGLANPYAELRINWPAAGISPYVAGSKYMLSMYIYTDKDFWWLPRNAQSSSDFGQGAIWCRAGQVTRVSAMGFAYSSTLIDVGVSPTTAPGIVGNSNVPTLLVQNYNPGTSAWIGGLQIEPLPYTYLDGIAMIGDSTMQGSAQSNDRFYDFSDPNYRQVSTVLSSELQCPVFNRAASGETLADMDARWATDITPLKPRCRDVIIQGGVNDFGGTRTFAQAQTSVQSMVAKATADGFAVKFLTCTPSDSIIASGTKEGYRQSFNAWLQSTYGSAVCDINEIVEDSTRSGYMLGVSDGTHYNGATKTAVGIYIARTLDWSWRIQPSAYVKVET